MPRTRARDDRDFDRPTSTFSSGITSPRSPGAAPIIDRASRLLGLGPRALVVVWARSSWRGARLRRARRQRARRGPIDRGHRGSVLSGRARILFLSFVMVLIWLVARGLLDGDRGAVRLHATAVLPINIEIVIAIAIGWLIYKRKVGALVPSIVALGLLYLFVYLGTLMPAVVGEPRLSAAGARKGWILLLARLLRVASLLPVCCCCSRAITSTAISSSSGSALVRRAVHRRARVRRARDPKLRRGGAVGLPAPLRHHRVRRDQRLPRAGLERDHEQQLSKLSDARFIGYGSMIGEARSRWPPPWPRSRASGW